MNNEQREYMRRTEYVLNRNYTELELLFGFPFGSKTPIFDALAADRFASDRKTEEPAHYPIWSEMPCFCVEETTFNLGDYR